ncbi:FkbM family methyltransferase [Aliiroseovarius sp.]|uniref:FkbM family methyltransferase n=1 Tax=Aliiroseovarius sp. TaxID=1872442 RepID=UPI002633842B|nr:FkbM family methyltransferase [Aliiroseovarius sp.]
MDFSRAQRNGFGAGEARAEDFNLASFNIDGIKLRVPGHCLTPPLTRALESGHYEWNEKAALKQHLEPGDRVLELGAGAGYLSILSAQRIGAENVTSIEANSAMLEVLRKNLDSNGARDVTLHHGAVVPDSHDGSVVRFHMREAFWASSVAGEGATPEQVVEVPALRLSGLLAEVQPTVVVMDVEGAEPELCEGDWPDCVRLLIMEIHTRLYSPARVKAMFDALSRSGFTYMPWGTRGEVVTLQRVVEAG